MGIFCKLILGKDRKCGWNFIGLTSVLGKVMLVNVMKEFRKPNAFQMFRKTCFSDLQIKCFEKNKMINITTEIHC